MKRVLLILSRGFEELEAVAPLDLLRRAGIEAVSASTGSDLAVAGGRGIVLVADILLRDCLEEKFDMLILPGGPGVGDLRRNQVVIDLARRYRERGIPIAAICAAPLVLADAGVISGSKITSFPASREELQGHIREYSEERVVVDGDIITSRGAGSSEEFALKLIEILLGASAAEDVRRRIVAR
jgi:4-methyl-5(b-hydroxyethyl)-thiazole monophosphate biosynthesis